MITLETARTVMLFVSMLLAYVIVVPIVGYARAWMAKKMGDDTPEELGFLTIDPMQHADFFGLLCLLLFKVGWGKNSPVNPANIIYRPHGHLKVALVFFTDAVCYFLCALVALTSKLVLLGNSASVLAGRSLAGQTSLVISIDSVLTYIVFWTLFLSAIFVLIRSFELLMVLNPSWFAYYASHNRFFLTLFYLVVILFLTRPVQIVLGMIMYYLAIGIVQIFGIA